MVKLIFPLAIMVSFLSCMRNHNGELESRIRKTIAQNCISDTCVVDLSNVISSKWSKLFIFKETASIEEVEGALSQKYPHFSDVARRIILVDEKNNIIYHEDIFPDFEGVLHEDIIFFIPDSLNFQVYSNAKFIVKKEKIADGYYYLLSQ